MNRTVHFKMQCTIHVQQNERLERTTELSCTNVRKITNIGMGIIFWNTSTTVLKKSKEGRFRLNLGGFFGFFCYIRFNFEGFVSGKEVLFLFLFCLLHKTVQYLSVICICCFSCSCKPKLNFQECAPIYMS